MTTFPAYLTRTNVYKNGELTVAELVLEAKIGDIAVQAWNPPSEVFGNVAVAGDGFGLSWRLLRSGEFMLVTGFTPPGVSFDPTEVLELAYRAIFGKIPPNGVFPQQWD